MVKLFILFFAVFVSLAVKAQETSSITDDRDSKTYKTVKIGNQWWLAQNLQFECPNKNLAYWADEAKSELGLLYRPYYSLVKMNNVCPAGWHVSTDEDWLALERFIGIPSSELKTFNWTNRGGNQNVQGKLNDLGFNGQSYKANGKFFFFAGLSSVYLTSTENGNQGYIFRGFGDEGSLISRRSDNLEKVEFSIRCVKN